MKLAVLSLLASAAFLHADIAGDFKGTWVSTASGSSGEIRIVLTSGPTGNAEARSSFTYQGEEVKTAPVSLKITGDDVAVVYEYDLGGAKLHSTLRGTLTGNTMKGRYLAQDAGHQPVDEGTWEATRK